MQSKFARINIKHQDITYHSDPLSLYQHLCHDSHHTLLLESAEIDTKAHRQSILMPHSALMIRCDDNHVNFVALTNNGSALLPFIEQYFIQQPEFIITNKIETQFVTIELIKNKTIFDEDNRLKSASLLDGLRLFMTKVTEQQTATCLNIFLGGVLAYDLIDTVEPLPKIKDGINQCPNYLFYLAENLIVIDHIEQNAKVYSFHYAQNQIIHSQLQAQTDRLLQKAQQECIAQHGSAQPQHKAETNIDDDTFKQHVINVKKHIIAGDVFQAVPSRNFSIPCPNPLGAYRALRETNPSPYMFYLQTDKFTLFGASPESALKYESATNQVEVYPIAGTRPRGKHHDGTIDHDLDTRIEVELRLDKKELSEHLMLVDLARNDISRITLANSKQIPRLLSVDRYSHVMHLVSQVTGQLKPDLDALHAYQACMNMGTLVGAPKIRAAQLVREIEQTRRGSYGGAVGYINSHGDMDTCIVIRSAYVSDGIANIQAGAGVVYDSDPQAEADETRQKAQAVINAILIGGGI